MLPMINPDLSALHLADRLLSIARSGASFSATKKVQLDRLQRGAAEVGGEHAERIFALVLAARSALQANETPSMASADEAEFAWVTIPPVDTCEVFARSLLDTMWEGRASR